MGTKNQNHWFSFKDACVSIAETGQGPTLIFLHGRFGHADIWKPVVEDLAASYRCITMNLPGFGHSYLARSRSFSLLEHANLVSEVILKFTPPSERAVLVGHDFGGALAQYGVFRHPEKIASLVLINSMVLNQTLERLNLGYQGLLVRWKLNRLLKEAKNLDPTFRENLTALWNSRPFRKSILKACHAIDESWPGFYERQVWKGFFEKLDLPVLIIWGKKDSLNPPESANGLIQRFRDVNYFLNEEAGHWPSLEKTDWVLIKLRKFLSGHDINVARKVSFSQIAL